MSWEIWEDNLQLNLFGWLDLSVQKIILSNVDYDNVDNDLISGDIKPWPYVDSSDNEFFLALLNPSHPCVSNQYLSLLSTVLYVIKAVIALSCAPSFLLVISLFRMCTVDESKHGILSFSYLY